MARLLFVTLLMLFAQAPGAATVALIEVRGTINPASAEYLSQAIKQSVQGGAGLLLIKLDTPGGLDSAMRDMVRDILGAPIPVITYVAPSGARAASAGTFILYASHIAAMAPGTNLGAATPVPIGIGGEPPDKKPAAGNNGKPPADTLRAKQVNDAAAYIRSLAQLRGRNAEWAEVAVRDGKSLSAEDALQLGVIDLVAADTSELLRRIDGRSVRIANVERKLETAGAQMLVIERHWKNRLLDTIADPNIALLLLMIGIYGLLFEFYMPHSGALGIAGAICLLLAAYALQLLPINYVGLLLVVLGIALMAAEAFIPSFGALGVGGIAAFVAGAFMLIDADIPGMEISFALVIPLAMVSALALFATGTLALKARKRPLASGGAMVGGLAEALENFTDSGWVRAHGETWRARTRVPLERGESVRIVRLDGLTLEVEPLDHNNPKGETSCST